MVARSPGTAPPRDRQELTKDAYRTTPRVPGRGVRHKPAQVLRGNPRVELVQLGEFQLEDLSDPRQDFWSRAMAIGAPAGPFTAGSRLLAYLLGLQVTVALVHVFSEVCIY